MNETDVVIIGAGHNGLTCAAYLAMAGLRVKVVERRKVVGRRGGHRGVSSGLPQFGRGLHGQPAQPADHFRPETRRAWPAHRRAPRAEFPARPRRQLSCSPAKAAPAQSLAKLSERDAESLEAFNRRLEEIADVLRAFVLRAPPNIVEGLSAGAIRESFQRARRRQHPAPALAGAAAHRCSICSRARPARCWTRCSRAIWSRRCSVSTPSSAIMRAPMRRARPT